MSFRNTLLVLLFGGTLGVFLMREQERGTMEPFDRVHREFLKANPSPDEPVTALEEPAVVFARIADRDLSIRAFSSWPLEESDWQVVLQNLAAYTPKATAISAPLPFIRSGPGLTAAAQAIPLLSSGAPASTSPGDGPQQMPEGLPVLTVRGSALRIPELKSIRPPALPGTWAAGDIDMLPAEQKLTVDGDWCRVAMLARMGDKVVPTMALRALIDWSGIKPADLAVQPGVAITGGKSLRIPIDEAGFFRYYLSLAPFVPTVNADVFVLTRDRALADLPPDDEQRRHLENLKTRLLWFGHDDTASRRLKLPNGTPVSPASLTARAIAAIQTARFMRPLPPHFQWIPAGGTLLFCLWLTHWRKSRLWPGAFVAAVALIAASLYLYRHNHHWMPLGPSLALLAATVVLSYVLPTSKRKETLPDSPPTRSHRTQKSAPAAPVSVTASVPASVVPEPEPTPEIVPDPFSQPDVIVEPDVVEEEPAATVDAAEQGGGDTVEPEAEQVSAAQPRGRRNKKKKRK